jgi:two-component system, cell cycle sensor histidine kinase and response regulator CckA
MPTTPILDRARSDGPCSQDDVLDFTGMALREADADVLLRRALELVSRALAVDHVEILQLAPGGGGLVVRASTGRREAVAVGEVVPAGRESHAGYTLLVSEPVVVASLGDDGRFEDPRLLARGLVSSIGVVVDGGGGEPYGALVASSVRRRPFTVDHQHCLVVLADLLAGALRRIATEETLRAAEARYRTFVESLPIVTYVDELDATSSSIYASPQIERLSGYAAEEWAADPDLFVRLLHPDDRERVLAEHARLRDPGDRLSTEYRLVARNDRVVWVNDRATVVRDGPGSAAYLQGVLLDVTERKRLDDRLAQSQRLEAIGRLAGGIAHDFNNLLTGIIGYADGVLQNLSASDPLRGDVAEIVAAGQRASRLTRQLLAFSRTQVLAPRVVGVNDVVAEMQGLLERVLGGDVRLDVRLERELGNVRADPGQLEQVVMNLAVNARDAMPGGGTLSIETANVELGDEYVDRHLVQAPPGRYVLLAVGDTGHGMDRETMEQIFEPFFTTKAPGEGTGLGLSTVYGIVKQSGGFVWPYSEPGRGTVFRIYLPRVDEPADAKPPRPLRPAAGTRRSSSSTTTSSSGR